MPKVKAKTISIYDVIGLTKAQIAGITADTKQHYITYVIRKSDGKSKRIIDAPQEPLKSMQTILLNNLLYKFKSNNIAHGFVVGRSPKTNAQQHVGAKTLIKMDISNFFNSISKRKVIQTMSLLLAAMEKSGTLTEPPSLEDAMLLADLVCVKGRLPQGAPTSPAMANIYAWSMDKSLTSSIGNSKAYVGKGIRVTRYADDITVSSKQKLEKDEITTIIRDITHIVRASGLRVNYKKTRVKTAIGRLSVTGVVVNSKPNLSKDDYKVMRAKVHNHVTGKTPLDAEGVQALRGQLEWLRSINPERGLKLIEQLGKTQSKKSTSSKPKTQKLAQ